MWIRRTVGRLTLDKILLKKQSVLAVLDYSSLGIEKYEINKISFECEGHFSRNMLGMLGIWNSRVNFVQIIIPINLQSINSDVFEVTRNHSSFYRFFFTKISMCAFEISNLIPEKIKKGFHMILKMLRIFPVQPEVRYH